MIKIIIKIFLFTAIITFTLHAKDININKLIDTATSSNKHLFIFLNQRECGYYVSDIQEEL